MEHVKLKVKLIGSFVLMGMLVVFAGLSVYYGLSMSKKILVDIIHAEDLSKQLFEQELEHFIWARKVGQFQRDKKIILLGVELNADKCSLGIWYDSDEQENSKKEIPAIKFFLLKMKNYHQKLHESAKEIEDILKKGNEESH